MSASSRRNLTLAHRFCGAARAFWSLFEVGRQRSVQINFEIIESTSKIAAITGSVWSGTPFVTVG